MNKLFPVLCVVILLVGCQSEQVTGTTVTVADGSYQNITAAELNTMLKDKDFILVNVHIPFAEDIASTDLSTPYDKIEQNLAQLPSDKTAKIVLYCRSGRTPTGFLWVRKPSTRAGVFTLGYVFRIPLTLKP